MERRLQPNAIQFENFKLKALLCQSTLNLARLLDRLLLPSNMEGEGGMRVELKGAPLAPCWFANPQF
jgi:hypothetical protein